MDNKLSLEERVLILEDKERRLSRLVSEHEGFIWRAKESRFHQTINLTVVILQLVILLLLLLRL